MKIKSVFVLAAMFSTTAFAKNNLSESCLRKATYKIIEMMQAQEPGAELRLVQNADGLTVGITDLKNLYTDYDFTGVSIDKSMAQVSFHSGDAISFAIVNLGQTKKECKIVSTDMGQDDQDGE